MKRILCILFIYLVSTTVDSIPTGLVDNSKIVYNAVAATPRFPGVRPKPEATTFLPTENNDGDNILKDETIVEDLFGEDNESEDSINERHNIPNNAPCRIESKTVYEIQEVETEEEKCFTVNERKCETTLRNQCVPYVENVCQTVQRDKCYTELKQQCQQLFREEEKSYIEDKCETKTVRKCEKYWKVVSNNRKVWEEDPNKCQDVLETDCSPVTKVAINKIPYQECIQVPFEKCSPVEETVCKDVSREKCSLVPCEECRNVPKEQCVKEHRLVPKQIEKQVQVRICDNSENGRDIITEYDDEYDDEQDNIIIPTQRPIIQPTEETPVRILDSNQGQSNLTELLLTGKCLSWNGKACTDDDTVNVGRGAGSCNSNLDCPCCAPFCSKSGYCQVTNTVSSSESCPIPSTQRDCNGKVNHTCWSPGVHDIDCPGHGLCCFDGCSNTCYNENKSQQPGFFESNIAPILNSENVQNSATSDCSCNEYVSESGYGRCEKDFGIGPVCYVNQPSTCTDTVNSSNEPGKQYSWEACTWRRSLADKPPKTLVHIDTEDGYTLTDDVIDLRPSTFPCTCTDYVNKNGVGNCTQNEHENRFNNENICYVSLPSSCPDLKNSITDAGKFLSAVACQTNKNSNAVTNSIEKASHY